MTLLETPPARQHRCTLTVPRVPSLGTASRHPPAAAQTPRLQEEGEAAVLGRGIWTHFIPISRLGRRVECRAPESPPRSTQPARQGGSGRCFRIPQPPTLRAKSNEVWKGLVCFAEQIALLAVSA